MLRNPTGISSALNMSKNNSSRKKTRNSKPKDSTNESVRKLIRNSPKGTKYDR